jgi:Zn-finger nucleic acid-binding protein
MSLLTCPVCKGTMREMNKQGVTIDVCTQCRGVWLDRGELEKLAGMFPGGDAPAYAPPPPAQAAAGYPPQPPQYGHPQGHYGGKRRDWDDDDDDDRRKYGYGQPQKSKMKKFLDFFD